MDNYYTNTHTHTNHGYEIPVALSILAEIAKWLKQERWNVKKAKNQKCSYVHYPYHPYGLSVFDLLLNH